VLAQRGRWTLSLLDQPCHYLPVRMHREGTEVLCAPHNCTGEWILKQTRPGGGEKGQVPYSDSQVVTLVPPRQQSSDLVSANPWAPPQEGQCGPQNCTSATSCRPCFFLLSMDAVCAILHQLDVMLTTPPVLGEEPQSLGGTVVGS
jgi:hypothetical protein